MISDLFKDRIVFWASQIRSMPTSFREGIYPSEMAAFLGLCDFVGVESIVESGRGQYAYSTQILKMYGTQKKVDIYSMDFFSVEALQIENPVKVLESVKCYQGNSFLTFPRITNQLKGKVALLVDGPKLDQANLFSITATRICNLHVVAHHNCLQNHVSGQNFFNRFREPFYYEDLSLDARNEWNDFKKWEYSFTKSAHSDRSFDHSSLAMSFIDSGQENCLLQNEKIIGFKEWWLLNCWMLLKQFASIS